MEAIVLCLAAYSFDATDDKTQWSNVCTNIGSVIRHSNENNIEPEALMALSWHETRWRNKLVSKAGACGIVQVIPKYTVPRVTCRELQDNNVGFKYGAIALRNWLDYSNNKLSRAFCHYNSGNTCFKRARIYARHVKRSYRRLRKLSNEIRENMVSYASKISSNMLF